MSEIHKALLAAQMQMPTINKTKVNPFYHSKYAPLDEVYATVIPVLNANGLVYVENIDANATGQYLIAAIVHAESGERHIGSYPLVPEKNTPQGMGIAITYARRYLLQCMTGVTPEDDTDGEGLRQNTAATQPQHKGVDFSRVPEVVSPQEAGSARIDWGAGADDQPGTPPAYVIVRQHMMAKSKAIETFMKLAKEYDRNGSGPCSPAQYAKLLVPTIDYLTDKQHNIVLSALADREVSKDAVPSKDLTKALSDRLKEFSKNQETGEYDVPNPRFSPETVDTVRLIGKVAKELGA